MLKNEHLDGIKNIMELIENKRLKFRDQYGNIYDVFDDDSFMYKESVYFKDYDEPTMHNPAFPCSQINDISFYPFCSYNLGENQILKENTCKDCLYYNAKNDYDVYSDFVRKHTFTPDIGIGKDGKFTYWLEIVDSSTSSLTKRKFVHGRNWTTLEIHLEQIRQIRGNIVECFNLTNLEAYEYTYIEKIYNIYDKLANSKTELEESIDNIFNDIDMNRLINGESLSFQMIIEKVASDVHEDAIKIVNKVKKYLRNKYNCSIRDFTKESYSDQTLEKFNMKRRLSVIHKTVGAEMDEYKKDEYEKNI